MMPTCANCYSYYTRKDLGCPSCKSMKINEAPSQGKTHGHVKRRSISSEQTSTSTSSMEFSKIAHADLTPLSLLAALLKTSNRKKNGDLDPSIIEQFLSVTEELETDSILWLLEVSSIPDASNEKAISRQINFLDLLLEVLARPTAEESMNAGNRMRNMVVTLQALAESLPTNGNLPDELARLEYRLNKALVEALILAFNTKIQRPVLQEWELRNFINIGFKKLSSSLRTLDLDYIPDYYLKLRDFIVTLVKNDPQQGTMAKIVLNSLVHVAWTKRYQFSKLLDDDLLFLSLQHDPKHSLECLLNNGLLHINFSVNKKARQSLLKIFISSNIPSSAIARILTVIPTLTLEKSLAREFFLEHLHLLLFMHQEELTREQHGQLLKNLHSLEGPRESVLSVEHALLLLEHANEHHEVIEQVEREWIESKIGVISLPSERMPREDEDAVISYPERMTFLLHWTKVQHLTFHLAKILRHAPDHIDSAWNAPCDSLTLIKELKATSTRQRLKEIITIFLMEYPEILDLIDDLAFGFLLLEDQFQDFLGS